MMILPVNSLWETLLWRILYQHTGGRAYKLQDHEMEIIAAPNTHISQSRDKDDGY